MCIWFNGVTPTKENKAIKYKEKRLLPTTVGRVGNKSIRTEEESS